VTGGLRWGVEPICATLQIAASTYYAAKTRPPSARAVRDAVLMPVLLALWTDNYRVYGAHKLWKAARRAGHDIGRDQTARLMRLMAIRGVTRRRRVTTTRRDEQADRHPDLVDREFVADRPDALWVTDLTYVPTWAGVAYVCFIVDAFSRRIVGWRVAGHMRTAMVLDALEMARWSRGNPHEGRGCHTDAGSQGGIKRSSQHLELEVVRHVQARACGGGPGDARHDVVAGSSVERAARGSRGVLGGDRPRRDDRGRGRRGRGVFRRWQQVVPRWWRHAIADVGPGLGALPVICGARRDRDPARPAVGRA
jgi:transposase InsO family protein